MKLVTDQIAAIIFNLYSSRSIINIASYIRPGISIATVEYVGADSSKNWD